jgi:multidrug efflux pump subunit AcrA (membrane-fusion protein)
MGQRSLQLISSIVATLTGSVWRKAAFGLGAVIVLGLLLAVATWRGYRAGYEAADTTRRAEVAELQNAHAQALADAEAQARHRLEAALVRAHQLEGRYMAARKTIRRQAQKLTNQRITHASNTADGACRFGPEWVRLYNEAIGAGAGNRGDAVSAAAPGPAGNATAAPGPETGVFQGGEAVTPADILAHIRDYGRRNKEMEAQLNALIEFENREAAP